MALIVPRRWRIQPTTPVRLRPQYYNGLQIAVVPSFSAPELIDQSGTGHVITQVNTTLRAAPEGRAVQFNGSTAYVKIPVGLASAVFAGNSPFTQLSLFTTTSLAAVNCLASRRGDGDATGPAWAITTAGQYEFYDTTAFRVSGLTLAKINVPTVATLSGAGAGTAFFTHNQVASSGIACNANFSPGNNAYVLGAWDTASSLAGPMAGRQSLHLAWTRQIPLAELQEIGRAPYGVLFQPYERRVYSIVSAVGGNTIAVPAGSLTLTGLAPTVTATANQSIAVPAGSLALTGLAPTVTVGNAQTVAVPAGALTLTGLAPTVVATANQTIAVPAGSLSLTGNAPTVVVGDQQIVLVPAGVLNITGFAPVVIAGGPVVVSVPAGSLSLTGYAPTVDTGGRRNNAAGKAKRRKYEIQGKTYALTPGELEQVLSLVMREEEPEEEAPKVVVKAVKEVAKAVAAVPVEAPTYEANPAFDALWADMTRQHEHEAAESLRVIAQQIHEKAIFDDDQDILDIIALIP